MVFVRIGFWAKNYGCQIYRITTQTGRGRRMPFRKKERDAGQDKSDGQADLLKLKKKELLEILLRQGEEIDRLREENESLKAQLEDRNFKFDRIGSIAEASLAVTKIFEEAEKAAVLYLENIRSKVNEQGRR